VVQGVTFTDDAGRETLDAANLVIEAGTTVCLAGTTATDQAALAGLLVGLYRPERGVVTVGAYEPAGLSPVEARSLVTLVPHDPWIIADDSLHDNISFGARSVSRDTIRRTLSMLGLSRWPAAHPGNLNVRATDLSTLDRRLLGLARAVATDPALLVIERPTVGLSHDDEHKMLQAVERACRVRTAVVLSNRLAVARRADQVYVLDGGRPVPYNQANARHDRIWDRRIPPTAQSRTGRPRLRVIRPGDRPAAPPRSGPWEITLGQEMAPGLVASGLLGRNADTELWTAWDRTDKTPVRVRVPRHRPVTYRAWEQLSREQHVVLALDHPGVTGAGRADLNHELPFAAYEYLDSPSLVSTLRPHGQGLTPLEALAVGFDLAETLAYLHSRGYVHLDLRAGHIRRRHGRAVITDFAQARPVGRALPSDVVEGPITATDPPVAANPGMDVRALGVLLTRLNAEAIWPREVSDLVGQMQAPAVQDRPGADEVTAILAPFRTEEPMAADLARPRRNRHLRLVSGGT
jgi:ABC-type branched-subunit amino acid transport system ATPase component